MGVQGQFLKKFGVEVLKAALSAMIDSLARLVVAIGTIASRLCYASFPIPGLVASFNVWFLKFVSEVLNFFWIWRNLKRTAAKVTPRRAQQSGSSTPALRSLRTTSSFGYRAAHFYITTRSRSR